MNAKKMVCRVCGNEDGNIPHLVHEMMFGTRECFEYIECAACGSLSLAEIPADMSNHYPRGYYSFQNIARLHYPFWMRFLKRARARYALTGKGALGKFLAKRQGLWSYFTWFKEAGVGFKSSLLDVGCGNGDYLLRFASEGFTNLMGVDPFIDKDIHFPNGITIYKRPLEEMEGQFDCVFSRHSFEHVVAPVAAIKAMQALIKPGGVALIAVPVAGSVLWDEYGTNWYQIDAPRHITVPSAKAMKMLAETAGLVLERTLYDSSEDQFLASEAYKRGISLSQLQTHEYDHLFTDEQRRLFREKAEKANVAGRGDQACFILRKRP